MERVFFVTGTAGTGKSTVLRELAKQQYEVVGLDEDPGLVTWVSKETGKPVPRGSELTDEFLANHDWGCSISALQQLIATKERPLVICGSCDNFKEVMALCEKTLVLVCEPEVFIPRIQQRTDNSYGQTESALNAVLGYYESYRNECVQAGAYAVDASQPVAQVVVDIINVSQ